MRRIFWPSTITAGSGYLVGWRASDDLITIVTLLQDVDHAAATRVIEALSLRQDLIDRCHGPPGIIGCVGDLSADGLPHFVLRQGRPSLTSKDVDLIIYRPPNPRRLEFLALRPLDLGLSLPSTRDEQLEKLSANVARAIELDWLGPTQTGQLDIADLPLALAQINCSHDVSNAVHGRRPASSRLAPLVLARPVLQLIAFALIPLNVATSTLLAVWSAPLPILLGASIKDLSASVQQLDVRLEQALSTPSQFKRIEQHGQAELSVSRSQYIAVYNMLWLVANDVILGSAVSAILMENANALAVPLRHALRTYGVEHVETAVVWLTQWPLGLKLNDELGSFFRDALLWLTAFWSQAFIRPLCDSLPSVIMLVGAASWLGLTMTLSLASDLLALSTVHLYVFNLLMTSLYDWHLRVLFSLYNIFRGRKYNVLRARLEPHVYSVDQLLVGTVLFTLATFLFPTVLTFHLFCASTRLLIIAMHASLETLLAFINHFPLFAVLLRLKEPGRLPGGLRFKISGSSLVVQNKPVEMSAIFSRHAKLSRRLMAHYSPLELIKKTFSGRVLRVIDRWQLRYSTT